MTNYIGPYTNQDGTPCLIDADNVGAFIGVPTLGAIYTGVFPVGVFAAPFIITEDPSAFAVTLAGLGRTLSPQTQDDGTPIVFVLDNGPTGTVLKTVGTSPDLTAVYSVDSDPFIVLGDLATLAAALTPPPNPPFGLPFRNTFDGYSSQLGTSDFVSTFDSDRLISAGELVHGNSLTWDQPGTTPRAWTMPSLASMDAEISGSSSGVPLAVPGSGGKSLWVVNKSNAPLAVLDSADFRCADGVGGITIPPRCKALLTWSRAQNVIVDGSGVGPQPATWFLSVDASTPRAGDVWAGSIVNPGTGQPVPGYVFGDVASGAPYVPNSGAYTFTFKPVPPGWNYLVMTTADQPGQCVFSGNEGGPSVCVVFATQIGGPWLDATPFKFVIVLVPPLGS